MTISSYLKSTAPLKTSKHCNHFSFPIDSNTLFQNVEMALLSPSFQGNLGYMKTRILPSFCIDHRVMYIN